MADNVTVIEIVAQVTDKTDPGVTKATKRVDKFEESMKKTQKQMKSLDDTKVEPEIRAVDKATAVMKKTEAGIKKITGKVWHVTLKALDFVTAPFRGILRMLSNPIVAAAGIAGVSIGVGDLINTYKDFEQTMANVRAVSGASAGEMKDLTKVAKELGASTAFSAMEVGQGMYYLGQAGWKTNAIIAAMPGLLDLAAAGDVELATASDIVSSSMSAFKMRAEEAGRAADVFAQTASASQTGVVELGESFKYIAPLAGTLGYSLEDVSIGLGLMANKSISGSMAGTQLRGVLARMSGQADETGEDTSKVAVAMKKLGLSMTDSTGKVKPFMEVMKDMRTGFSKLTDAQKSTYAAMLGGQNAMSGILAIVGSTDAEFEEMTRSIYDSAGAAERMAKIRMDTLAGSFEELGGAVETIKIEAMEKLAPYLRSFVDWLTGKMPQVSAAVGKAVDFIGQKIEGTIALLKEIGASAEWQNADFFGKVRIAWDKIIAEPFKKWWDGGGGEKVGTVLKEVGKFIARGIIEGLGVIKDIAFSNPITGTLATAWLGSKAIGGVSNAVSGISNGLQFANGAKAAWGAAQGGQAAASALAFIQQGGGAGAAGAAKMTGVAPVLTKIGTALAGIASSPVAWIVGVGAVAVAGFKIWEGIQNRMQKELLETGQRLREASDRYKTTMDKISDSSDVIRNYRQINDEIANFKGPADELAALEDRRMAFVERMKKEYPESFENGASIDQAIANIDELLGRERELARLAMERRYFEEKGRQGNLERTYGAQLKLADAEVENINVANATKGKMLKLEGLVQRHDFAGEGLYPELSASAKIALQDEIIALMKEIATSTEGNMGPWNSSFVGMTDGIDTKRYNSTVNNTPFTFGLDFGAGSSIMNELDAEADAARMRRDIAKANADEAMYSMQEIYNAGAMIIGNNAGVDIGETTRKIGNLAKASGELAKNGVIAEETMVLLKDVLPDFEKNTGTAEEKQAILRKTMTELAAPMRTVLDLITNLNAKFALLPEDKKINVSLMYDLLGTTPGAQGPSGFIGPMPKHADGGIMTRPHQGLVAEDGAEAIIPLSGKRRRRGLSLWEQAGRMLGVKPYADGGMVGAIGTGVTPLSPVPRGGGGISVPVSIGSITFQVTIDGATDTESIMAMLKERAKDLTDEIAYNLAVSLQQVFANMPKTAEGAG